MGMTSVRMPDELLDELELAAEKLDRSKGWIINDAVKEYLAKEDRKEQIRKETMEALADIKAGRVANGDAVIEWLGSWGAQQEKEPPKK